MSVEGSERKHFGNNSSTYVIECQEIDSLLDQLIPSSHETNVFIFFLFEKEKSVLCRSLVRSAEDIET